MTFDSLFDQTVKKVQSLPLSDLDAEWISDPPTFDEFISSGDYINPVVLSDRQYKSCISVLGTEPKKIFSPERQISLGVLCVGKGGGKDWLVAIILCYVNTVLQYLRNPQRFFMIDDTLDILNVSIKGENADQVFFNKFKQRVKENKYFLENFEMYENNKRINVIKKQNSRGLIKIGSGQIIFPNRIRCFSETSNNESWEGYNVIFFILDEISGFKTEKSALNGWNIFKTAKTSCISRRTKNFKGIGYVISYPRQEKGDIIIDLYEMSKLPENDFMFGMKCFAWQFKPEHLRDGRTFTFVNQRFNRAFGIEESKMVGIKIPIEYQEDFSTDPENSLTCYCAIPPKTAGTWVEYPDRVLAAIDYQQKPLFLTQDVIYEKTMDDGKTYKYKGKEIIACTEKNFDLRMNTAYVAWLDNAETNCDAVIAIARKDIEKKVDSNGRTYEDVVCRIVDVINWNPDPGIPIDLQNVEDFLLKKIPTYVNLKEVGKDRWESALLSNKLIRKGINSVRYNLGEKNYNIAKYFFYLGAVKIFNEENHLNEAKKELTSLEQFLSLINTEHGPKKRDGLKKDKSDAVVGCINLLLGKYYESESAKPLLQKVGIMGKAKTTTDPYSSTRMFSSDNSPRVLTSPDNLNNENKKLPTAKLVR